jgi:hypothetical protein
MSLPCLISKPNVPEEVFGFTTCQRILFEVPNSKAPCESTELELFMIIPSEIVSKTNATGLTPSTPPDNVVVNAYGFVALGNNTVEPVGPVLAMNPFPLAPDTAEVIVNTLPPLNDPDIMLDNTVDDAIASHRSVKYVDTDVNEELKYNVCWKDEY